MIDPTNSVLHLKDVLFVLLVATCALCFKPNFKRLIPITVLFISFLIPWIIEEIRQTNYDTSEALALLKSMSPIVLLLWVDHFDLIKLSRGPVVICCTIVSILFILMVNFPEVENLVWTFNTVNGEPMMMSRRWILGIEIFANYLKSTPVFIFALTFYFYALFNKKLRGVRRTIYLSIIVFNFIVSGTRSTMLTPFFILGIVLFSEYKDNPKVKQFIYPILITGAFLFLGLIFMLASETTEYSNVIKYGHLTSYMSLFESHPVNLLFGQGPGTSFYSEGFNQIVYKTEWSYLELIRDFGIFSIAIVAVYAYPLKRIWQNRKDNFTLCIFATYIAYLLIAGTNPLLLSSTGMLALLFAYSYEGCYLTDQKQISESQRNDKNSLHSL